jgi:hypothetical protein
VLRFPAGSRITATEAPAQDWYFASWYGVCRYGNWATTCERPPVAPVGQQFWGLTAEFQLPIPLGQTVPVGMAPGVVSSEVDWYQRVNGSTTASTVPGHLPAPAGKTYLVVEASVAYETATISARVDWRSFVSGMQTPQLWTTDPANGAVCGVPTSALVGSSTIASVPAPTASGQWVTFDDYFLVPASCTNAYVLYRPDRVAAPTLPGVTGVSGFALH